MAALKTDVATLGGEMKALEANLKSTMIAQISLLRAETIKWIVSALAFNFLGIAALIVTLAKAFGR